MTLTDNQRKSLAIWRANAERMERATWLDLPDMDPIDARLAICSLALELQCACTMVEIVAEEREP